MKETLKVRGTVECPGFVGSQRIVSFEFAGPVLLHFRRGVAKFSIRVPVGTTSVRAKTAWTLAKREGVVNPHFVLLAGDVNGDNKVNALDYSYLRYYLNRGRSVVELPESAAADLDGDGIVGPADRALFLSALGHVGDE